MAKSPRELLVELMALAQVEQSAAIQDLHNYLGSVEALGFKDVISNIRERTLPGGPLDQVLWGLLRVLESVTGVAAAEVSSAVKLQAVSDIAPDPLLIPEIVTPLPADAPIPADEPLFFSRVEALAPDESGGEV